MTLEEYKKSKNFYYFYEISKIPRPSFHEERVADYTIHERMNADSFYRTYEYLKEILAQA